MFGFFKKENEAINNLAEIQKTKKENLEDFILILKQIQDANNKKTVGQGSFLKDSKQRQQLIENIVTLSIEETERKIKELG